MSIGTIILFLIILAVLIFVHELGHFAAAKWFGIRVDEFAIGFPPRIASWKRGETTYALNAVPFGGYVKIFGEDPDEAPVGEADRARSLAYAAWWKQVIILLSGIVMNIVFAWILISLSLHIGLLTNLDQEYAPQATNPQTMIISVVKNSPADLAGLADNDTIVAIASGKSSFEHPTISEIQNVVAESSGTITIAYEHDTTLHTAHLTAGPVAGGSSKAIGIAMSLVGTIHFSFLKSWYEGAKLTWFETKDIITTLWSFIVSTVHGNGSNVLSELSGPVGIASMVGQAQSVGLSYLLGFIALISINLAVLNVIPFPAFDGGRVLFVLIETVTRKKIKPSIANAINLIGFLLIILLMLVITYHDILRLIGHS